MFDINPEISKQITDEIDKGDLSHKPGFTRISLHPIMSDKAVAFICSAIKEIAECGEEWAKDYKFDKESNEFIHRNQKPAFDLAKAFTI